MKRLHILGNRNHGKTTLVLELVEELTRRGFVVGTIKHTSHLHDLDTPGKDSWRHRKAGATPASITTPELFGVFVPRPEGIDQYEWMAPLYAHCDLVLVEGDRDAEGLKVEVWREERGNTPIASSRQDILAIISDEQPPWEGEVLPRSDLNSLVERLLLLVENST